MIQTSNCVQKFDLVKQRTCCCPYSSHRNHFPCLLFFFTCAASLSSILYSFIVLLSHFNLVPIHPDLSAWLLHKQQRHVVRIHNQKENICEYLFEFIPVCTYLCMTACLSHLFFRLRPFFTLSFICLIFPINKPPLRLPAEDD